MSLDSAERGLLITLTKIVQGQMKQVQDAHRQKGFKNPKLDEDIQALDQSFRLWRLAWEEREKSRKHAEAVQGYGENLLPVQPDTEDMAQV